MNQSQRKRLLLIDEDMLSNQEVKRKLAGSQTLTVCGEVTRYSDVWQSMQTTAPDVVLIGSLRDVHLHMLCQQICFYFPQVICIASCPEKEFQWDPFLRSAGVWVLSKPIVAEELEMASHQLASVAAQIPVGHGFSPTTHIHNGREQTWNKPQLKQKHFITVYGPKGGVGKTFLSRELAIYFATMRQEEQPLKVLAVDFNLDLGTFATTLNLARTPNIFTWVQDIDQQLAGLAMRDLRDPETLHHTEWQEYSTILQLTQQDVEKHIVVHAESGLHVLTSPRDIRQSFDIKDYHLYVMLETLKQSDYDVILIDTAPDTTDATIQALFFAERVVMVGNPVVDAIENIQRMMKLLREADYPEERIQICINRLQRREMFTLEEMKAYFQLHPSKSIFTIPDDEEVKRSINTGVPLMMTTGKSTAKEAICALGKSLVPQVTEKETESATQKKKGKASFFSWLQRGGA